MGGGGDGDGDGGDGFGDGLGSGSGGSRGVSMDKVKRIDDDDDFDFDVDADQAQRRCLKKRRRRRDLDDDDDEEEDDDVVDVDGKHVVDRWDARVKVGDRLEVQWEVVKDEDYDDDDGVKEEEEANERRVRVKWWPCVVVRGDDGEEDEAKMSRSETTSFGLVYDAMDGFESERRRVVFSRAGGARQLEHAGEAGMFRWRREGDVDDVQHDDSDDDDAENAIEDAPTTMREILEAQGAIDAENGGVSLESAAMGAFATLPMSQQMNMATAFAGFKEKLMAKLSGLAAEKGAEGVVTKDDIDGILSDIQKGA